MANILLNDVVEVKTYSRCGAQNGIMAWHYVCTSQEGAGGSDEQLAENLEDVFPALLKACMTNQATYEGLTVQIIHPIRQPPNVQTDEVGIGDVVGDPCPTMVSGLVTLRTALSGRKYRGRKYIPFPSEASNDVEGKPLIGYVNAIAAFAAQLILPRSSGLAVNISTLKPCIWSRVPKLTTPVVGYVARQEWATQRRRSQINRGDLPVP